MKKRKVTLAIILSLVMIISMVPKGVHASEFTDMPNDWSKTALENAVENGLIKGDDGKIMPKDNLTRAQMATIVNRAFGTTEKVTLGNYIDVATDAWYYEDMAKAVQMKTFVGSGNQLNPDNNITREEAFVVLARAFKLSGADVSVLDNFSDKDLVSEWAKDGTASLISAGYVEGANGQLNPKKNITRAEFAQLMDNLLKNYIKTAGTYSLNYTGNVMINVPDVTLEDMMITGDLIIGDGVGDGNISLNSVVVTGRTVIRGGGVNSIKITGNSNLQDIIIARVDGEVRVYLEDGTQIGNIIVDGNDDVIIEGKVGNIIVVAPDVTVRAINANIGSAIVEGDNSVIIVSEGSSIELVTIEGKDAEIIVNLGASVDRIIINADGADISGSGKIGIVEANANDISVTTEGTEVIAGEGTKLIKAGSKSVAPGDSVIVSTIPIVIGGGSSGSGSSGGSSSSGSGSSSTVSVSGITVTPTTMSLTAGGATGTLAETVAPTNATDEAVTWSSSDELVATVLDGVVTPLTEGTTTITVTTSDGSFTATSVVSVAAATVAVTDVTLDQVTLDLTAGGATGTLAETVAPTNATNKAVTWLSSDVSVATVLDGVVTPLTEGTTTITVTTSDGSFTATSVVSVAAATVAVTDVTLDQVTLDLTAGGATGTLVETVAPSNATNQAVTWLSSNEAVATVIDGVVTPLTEGTTTITVTTSDGSFTATSVVTVAAPVAVILSEVSGLGMLTSEVTVKIEDTLIDTYTLYFDDAALASTTDGGVTIATGVLNDLSRVKILYNGVYYTVE